MRIAKYIIRVILFVAVVYSQDSDSIKNRLEIPRVEEDDQIVLHTNYVLSYNENCEQAEWVAYKLVYTKIDDDIERSDDFREDPKVLTGSASVSDYRGSGYDRGHLAPAADMKVNDEIMSESFYMSNMSPQAPSFNRGIWKQLEEKVREWVSTDDTLYVVTGPILYEGLSSIGENIVSVPKFYYKIILDYSLPEVKAIAFVLPNEKCDKPLSNYVVPIDWVEAITGIDFFPNLSDVDENQLESSVNAWQWFK